MSGVSYPVGTIPLAPEPIDLHTDRVSDFHIQLLDSHNKVIADLDGVTGGELEYNYSTKLMAGGKLQVEETSQDVNWLLDRVSVSVMINGEKLDRGLFIPTFPGSNWKDGHRSWDVELHSLLLVLDQDAYEGSFTVPENVNALQQVRDIIDSSGEDSSGIDEGDEITKSPMSWQPGTTKLQVANDLLSAAGYFAMRVDNQGNMSSKIYRRPADRPSEYDFVEGKNCLFVDEFSDEIDIFSIPNKIIAVGEGTGEEEAKVGVAKNEYGDDPFSYASRGRWVTQSYTGVDTTSDDAIRRYAEARLAENASPRRKIQIQHAPIGIEVNSAVNFTYATGAITGKFVIDTTTVTIDPLALQTTVLRET